MEKIETMAIKAAMASKYGAKLTILKGEAPKQHNPSPVNISGTISAPRKFIEKRKDTYDKNKSHCLVSLSDGWIRLIINEQDECNRYMIDGTVQIGNEFANLGINQPKEYRLQELANKLRLKRSIFKSHLDHSKLVNVLRNVEAKIEKDMKDQDDLRGNKNISLRQTVQSNVPDSFLLNIPLIEGEAANEIEVAIILDVENGAVVCYLESVEAADRIDGQLKELIESEVKQIEEHTTVIYV